MAERMSTGVAPSSSIWLFRTTGGGVGSPCSLSSEQDAKPPAANNTWGSLRHGNRSAMFGFFFCPVCCRSPFPGSASPDPAPRGFSGAFPGSGLGLPFWSAFPDAAPGGFPGAFSGSGSGCPAGAFAVSGPPLSPFVARHFGAAPAASFGPFSDGCLHFRSS